MQPLALFSIGLLLWLLYRQQHPVPPLSAWTLPPSGLPYRVNLTLAEQRYGLPAGLLGRVAWQESRFRPDIIRGETVSSAGAVGLMQIVPRWHPDVDPTDPIASIDYAAQYLRRLYDRFGDWQQALAAYNWGPTNLAMALKRDGDQWRRVLPRETRDYITDISRDVPV